MNSPCENCPRNNRCTLVCNDFTMWFIREWDENTAKLRRLLNWEGNNDKR